MRAVTPPAPAALATIRPMDARHAGHMALSVLTPAAKASNIGVAIGGRERPRRVLGVKQRRAAGAGPSKKNAPRSFSARGGRSRHSLDISVSRDASSVL